MRRVLTVVTLVLTLLISAAPAMASVVNIH
jgi:hypothetical protein